MGMTANQGAGYSSIAQGLIGVVGAFTEAEQLEMRSDVVQRDLKFREWYTNKQEADARKRGDIALAQARQQTRVEAGAAQAAAAGAGVDVGVGSALQQQFDIEMMGRITAATIRNNSAKEVMGIQLQRESLKAQRGIERASSRGERSAAYAEGAAQLGSSLMLAYGFFSKDQVPAGRKLVGAPRVDRAQPPVMGGLPTPKIRSRGGSLNA